MESTESMGIDGLWSYETHDAGVSLLFIYSCYFATFLRVFLLNQRTIIVLPDKKNNAGTFPRIKTNNPCFGLFLPLHR